MLWNAYELWPAGYSYKLSDFVTKSYGESWDSSCEKSWVPVKKKTVSPLVFYNQVVNLKTLQNSVLQNTEIKIQFFYFIAQQTLKEICIVKQQP